MVSEPRPGYGAAVHAGVLAATSEYLAVMDGDGSFDPATCSRCWRRSATDEPTWRPAGVARSAAASGRGTHGPATAVVLWWLRRRTGLPVHDIAPMRVCRREALLALDVRDRRFGYPVELLQKAQRAGWRITERDVAYLPRAEGTRSKVSGSVRGTVRAARDFARVLS